MRKKEDNVYVTTSRTEEFAEAKEQEKQTASTVAGKFKDVDALAQAYGSLQAEFTRRSQRLRELERAMDNLGKEKSSGGSGVEKLRRAYVARKEEKKAFDDFVSEMESAEFTPTGHGESEGGKVFDEAVDEEEQAGPVASEQRTDNSEVTESVAQSEDLEKDPKTPSVQEKEQEGAEDLKRTDENQNVVKSRELSESELYDRVCRNEQVRLKIIGEYLASIGKTGVPLTFAGEGTYVSPPIKARSILDAGNMAFRYFKTTTEK